MYCLSQPPDVLHALLEMCSETLWELDGDIAVRERSTRQGVDVLEGQAHSYRLGVLSRLVFLERKGFSGERELTWLVWVRQ